MITPIVVRTILQKITPHGVVGIFTLERKIAKRTSLGLKIHECEAGDMEPKLFELFEKSHSLPNVLPKAFLAIDDVL